MAWNVKWIKRVFLFIAIFPLIGIAQEIKSTNSQHVDSIWWENQKKGVHYFSEKPIRKDITRPKTTYDWGDITFLKYTLLFLIVLTLIYILYRLYGQSVFEFSSKPNPKKLLPLQEENLDERFLELDLNRLLKLALSQGDLKMAIRIHFLQVLKTLVDQERINWHSDLTNRQISYQLAPQTRKPFTDLVSIYEMAWYSNAKVDHVFYQRVKPKFDQYKKELIHE